MGAYAFHVSSPHPMSMRSNKDSYAAPKLRNKKYIDEYTFDVFPSNHYTAPAVRKYKGRRQQAKRISAIKKANNDRCLDLFDPNLSYRKQVPDALFYATSEGADNAKARLMDKPLFTPRGWPVNPGTRKLVKVSVVADEPQLCTFHAKLCEDNLRNDREKYYKENHDYQKGLANLANNPGTHESTYTKPKFKTDKKIRQVEQFDADMNSSIRFASAEQLMQTKDGKVLYSELQDLKTKIAGIVFDGDPLSH
jgi:hypothetical protein